MPDNDVPPTTLPETVAILLNLRLVSVRSAALELPLPVSVTRLASRLMVREPSEAAEAILPACL